MNYVRQFFLHAAKSSHRTTQSVLKNECAPTVKVLDYYVRFETAERFTLAQTKVQEMMTVDEYLIEFSMVYRKVKASPETPSRETEIKNQIFELHGRMKNIPPDNVTSYIYLLKGLHLLLGDPKALGIYVQLHQLAPLDRNKLAKEIGKFYLLTAQGHLRFWLCILTEHLEQLSTIFTSFKGDIC